MNNSPVLCVFGSEFYSSWVSQETSGRLILVEDRLDWVVPSHPRVTVYRIESPLQLLAVAEEIGRAAVFLPLEIRNASHSPSFPFFQKALEEAHRRANLILNDAADWGLLAASHAMENLRFPFRTMESLKGSLTNTPAILVGAGPSLEKNGHLLSSFQNKAAIFAGGSAIGTIPCPPDFAVCIDKDAPIRPHLHRHAPLFFQARMHPENNLQFEGERWLIPDSHFPFLNVWGDGCFESGWTVGNLMVSLALFLGCNPIVCVGYDFCYSEGRKYAFSGEQSGNDLVSTQDMFGKTVFTQRDWLAAAEWMEEVAKRDVQTTFLNATEGGLPFFTPCKLSHLDFSASACKHLPSSPLHRVDPKVLLGEILEKEEIEETLLSPLWRAWEPVFARECDPLTLPIHREIFMENVLSAHKAQLR